MNRLARLIRKMDKRDLLLLQKDLDAGNLDALIQQRLQQAKGKPSVCPTCGSRVQPEEGFLLQFGPSDLRKQARFDALDCMQFFIDDKLRD